MHYFPAQHSIHTLLGLSSDGYRKRHVASRWRLTIVLAFTAAPLIFASAETCKAQSLWQCRNRSKAYVFFDTQARAVGDTITVLVNESTDVDNRDQRALDRAADAKGGFSLAGALGGDFGGKDGDASFNVQTNGSSNFDGSSTYSVARGFTDQITVTVVECLPNGNLVIRGRRERTVSGERRALAVSGVIRPLDIRADNSIESRYIADFQICYDGDGIESRFTEQGWLTRAWNKYRPL